MLRHRAFITWAVAVVTACLMLPTNSAIAANKSNLNNQIQQVGEDLDNANSAVRKAMKEYREAAKNLPAAEAALKSAKAALARAKAAEDRKSTRLNSSHT